MAAAAAARTKLVTEHAINLPPAYSGRGGSGVFGRREPVLFAYMRGQRTSTSTFGVSGRENHDATAFYNRFRAPELSTDDRVLPPEPIVEPFIHGDARAMDAIADGSAALVVTSPPYFAGKQYEQELEREGVPSSYLEYLDLLTDVFAECLKKLEPGGRMAVNVANLGRKPYRSLSADVIGILQDDLGLLLRGELIWQKGEGANGSCAWGSFRSAANPVLRDITERVIIASKGRFDRARTRKQRAAEGLPFRNTVATDDFMASTLDVWPIPPESARRVGHPAPFPVELPEQLIRLYSYEGDLVLDPFMGSGSTLLAAALLGRRYAGYDIDAGYVEAARHRVEAAIPGTLPFDDPTDNGVHDGMSASRLAEQVLVEAGFVISARDKRITQTGVTVSFVAQDAAGASWIFDVAGASTARRGGLLRMEVVWRSLGRAAALKGGLGREVPFVLLTTNMPRRPSDGDTALRAAGPKTIFDVVPILAEDGRARLRRYADGAHSGQQLAGFWAPRELAIPANVATPGN